MDKLLTVIGVCLLNSLVFTVIHIFCCEFPNLMIFRILTLICIVSYIYCLIKIARKFKNEYIQIGVAIVFIIWGISYPVCMGSYVRMYYSERDSYLGVYIKYAVVKERPLIPGSDFTICITEDFHYAYRGLYWISDCSDTILVAMSYRGDLGDMYIYKKYPTSDEIKKAQRGWFMKNGKDTLFSQSDYDNWLFSLKKDYQHIKKLNQTKWFRME